MIAAALLAIFAQTRIWNSEERTTITSFNEVQSVAFDGNRVYASGPNGVEIYDAIFRRWQQPSTADVGYPYFARVLGSAYDRTQGGLWLSTSQGIFFRSDLNGRWEPRPFASSDPNVARALTQARTQSDAALQVLRGTMSVDASGRRWPITSVVPADREGTYFVGTNGNNILFADSRNLSSKPLVYGTLSRGVSAIAIGEKGEVWFGGDGAGPRNGVSVANADLQEWTWFESLTTRAPRGQVNRIIPGETTWLSASDGLYSYVASSRQWHRFDERDGLPSDNVRPILNTAQGLWVGTRDGLALLTNDRATTVLANRAINGLAERNDTIWAATSLGLFAIRDGAPVEVNVPSDLAPALGVAATANGIAVLAANGLHRYDGQWTRLNDASLAAIGRPFDLRAFDNVLYVLGTRGVAEIPLDGGASRYLSAPGDVSEGPVRDVVRAGTDLWLATPAGATRLRWPR